MQPTLIFRSFARSTRTPGVKLLRLRTFSQRAFHSSIRLSHGDHPHNHIHEMVTDSKANRITWIGFGVNLALTGAKAVVSQFSGSSALLADAAHSASDVLSDGVALLALRLSSRAPDASYPYGYGRVDTLGSLGVAMLLVGGGCEVGYSGATSLLRLLNDHNPTFDPAMGSWALGMAIVSIVVKEALFRATIHVGKEARSPVVVANAWHHRSDAFSSIVATVGVAGTMAGATYLDGLAGVLVSGFIVKAGVDIGWRAVRELADARVNESVIVAAHNVGDDLIKRGVIRGLQQVRCRQLGSYCLVDCLVLVDPQLSVGEAHKKGNEFRAELMEASVEVHDVFVHVCPEGDAEH